MGHSALYSVLVRSLEKHDTARESISKLKAYWQSLDPGGAVPCPLCFAFRDVISPLVRLPADSGEEPLQCQQCGETFYVPALRSNASNGVSASVSARHLASTVADREITAAYVTTYDPTDIRQWSGTGYHIHQSLQRGGLKTECIGNLRDTYALLSKAKKLAYSMLLKQTYLRDREPIAVRSYARQVDRALAARQCDVVFSPTSVPIAHLRTDKPVVFWTDSTFAGVTDFNPSFRNLCAETIRNGHRLEQAALTKCRLALYSSDWAARSAIEHYDVDPRKVKVVPFGANIECTRTREDIERLLADKPIDKCRLLFVGVAWFNKGGDVAVRVAERLRQRGLETELHVVGCTPPHAVPDFVKVHGFVSKETAEGKAWLDRLYSTAHFLVVPTRAECFGVVFAEASSFGLPSLGTNIGGIPSAIRDGRNGRTFGLDEDPEKYCDYILDTMSVKQIYRELALSSFAEYAQTLNWTSAGWTVRRLITEHCL